MAERELSAKEIKVDEDKGPEVKVKKITDKDFKKIETALKAELAKRKTSNYRKTHEAKWKEVDRQVQLDPMDSTGGDEETWLATFELGTLAQASEILTADILRVVFPEMKSWFETHIEVPQDLNPATGEPEPVNEKYQNNLDGRLKSMMTQQHIDFGLRDRVELSLKEALHHGGFVVEVAKDSMDMYYNGTDVKAISAPTWIPHSMWNAWPDPSPSLVGTNMFYTGSMFVRRYMPRHKFLEQAVGEGYIPKALKKIPKDEHDQKDNRTKDLELIYYWGDVVIPRSGDGVETSGEDMFFPNHKVIMANGKMVYIDAIDTPYPPVIYKGYEKMDVRDPYFTSPIIKQSPMQKITSILANEFVNGIQLQARPPIVYDGNDPDFVVNGGPTISPGAKTSTKGQANFKVMETGDPSGALKGLEFGLESMKGALGRPGIDVGNRATKAEVVTKQADSESGPFGFATKLDEALRTFLYMQHAMNLATKGFKYSYYNPEMDSPDFLRVTGEELPKTVNFEVVGSKGMLGEQQRHQAFTQVVAFASGNPMFAPMMEPESILKQIFSDAGVKGPERFLKHGDIPPALQAQMNQMQQMIQQLGQELQKEKSQSELKTNKMNLDYKAKEDKIKAQHERDLVHLASKHYESAQTQSADIEKMLTEFRHMLDLKDATENAKSKTEKAVE